MLSRRPSAGMSLLELLVVLVLVGVLAGLVAPVLSGSVHRLRVRGALDRLTADLYLTRSMAARSGARVELRFRPSSGCAQRYEITRGRKGRVLRVVDLKQTAPGVCLTSNVRGPMVIDARGLLIGSARTIRARAGSQADSAIVSMVGRVLRRY